LFAAHDTVALVALPVSSTNANGDELVAPLALFQFALDTTPAVSVAPIATSLPTKLMLIPFAPAPPEEVTPSVTVVLWVSIPLVAVMVSVELPTGVLPAVVTVSVELDPAATELGLNDAVAPVGNPLTANPIVPLNPLITPVFTV